MGLHVRRLLAWLLAAAIVVVGLPASGIAQSLRRSERAELARGQLVTRPTRRNVGRLRLFGGTSYQVVDASPDRVWRTMLETASYPSFLPQVSEARVVREDRRARRRNVYIEHRRGPLEASYNVELTYWPTRRHLEFRLDKTRRRSIREAWGFAHVAPYRGGKSLVTFGSMADIGGGLIGSALRGRVHTWMLRVPRLLMRFIENAPTRRA